MYKRVPHLRTLTLLTVFAGIVLTVFAEGRAASAQSSGVLRLGRPVTVELEPGARREFTLPLREGDFAEISWLVKDELSVNVKVLGPRGAKVLSGPEEPDNSYAFVAQASGDYSVSLLLDKNEGVKGPRRVTLQYRDKPQLPASEPKLARRLVNGYDVKIRSWEEQSVLTAEKGGRIRLFMRGGGGDISGFHFMDDTSEEFDESDSRSVALIKNTPDKTGDGAPDVAVTYYSGGAHCCFTAYFIELGERVRVAAEVDGDNVPVNAVGRAPGGGLRLETADNTFAYWLVSFADSPLPSITLEFRGGELRPAPELMRKRPPTLAKLRQEARQVRSQLGLEPYKGEEDASFEVAFWDRMLDLLYSGNETLAWQYFDLVWPAKKPGKALFRADFEKQLNLSWFWKATHPKR